MFKACPLFLSFLLNFILNFLLNLYFKFRAKKISTLKIFWCWIYKNFYNDLGFVQVLAYDEEYDLRPINIYSIMAINSVDMEAQNKNSHIKNLSFNYIKHMAKKCGQFNMDLFSIPNFEVKNKVKIYYTKETSLACLKDPFLKLEIKILDPLMETLDDEEIIGGMIILP